MNCKFYIQEEDSGLIATYLISTRRSFDVRRVNIDSNTRLNQFYVYDVTEDFGSEGSLIDDFVLGSILFL